MLFQHRLFPYKFPLKEKQRTIKDKFSFHSMSIGQVFFTKIEQTMTMCFELNYFHKGLKKNTYLIGKKSVGKKWRVFALVTNIFYRRNFLLTDFFYRQIIFTDELVFLFGQYFAFCCLKTPQLFKALPFWISDMEKLSS